MNPEFQNVSIIDAHLHLWDTDRMNYEWLKEESAINKSFFIEDYQQQTKNFNVEKMVFVQCECHPDQYLQELKFVEAQALKDKRIQGIVSYAPLEKGKEIVNVLEQLRDNPLVKGVRRMYGNDPKLCIDPQFIEAVRLLPIYNLSLDISIKPNEVKETLQMIRACPDTQFILDHLGKPDIKNDALDEFKENITAFASFPNVVAKISGLITETNRKDWNYETLNPYVSYAIEAFGFEKLMFGGDWPVVLLAGSYQQWLRALLRCLEIYSEEELRKLFYATANRIYRL